MECKHEKIRSTDCVLYCMQCGARLPDDWLSKEEAEKATKTKSTTGKAKGRGTK